MHPDDDAPAVDGHRQLADIVAAMVAAARAGHWQTLPVLDAQGAALFERLHRTDPAAEPLSACDRDRIQALWQRIRAGQDELAQLVRPQLEQLEMRMKQWRREQGAEH